MIKYSITFYTRPNKSGHSIYGRINFKGIEVRIKTGVEIEKLSNFDKVKQKVIRESGHENLNLILNKFELKIHQAFNYFGQNEIKPSKEHLVRFLEAKPISNNTVLSYGQQWLHNNRKRITYGTYKQLLSDLRKFEEFAPGLKIIEIDKSTINKYHQYLINVKENNPNTVQRSMKKLKFFLNQAQLDGLIKENPLNGFKFQGAPPSEISCLTEKHLAKLEALELNNRLQNIVELFLVQCYTGLSYSDLSTLRLDHIQTDNNNKKWINKARTKSDIAALVPLFPKAIEILNKKGFFEIGKLKVPTNQKYNDYLKEIADIINFRGRLSSHVGRKTCGMILLNNGVSIEAVSRILGHSSIKTTQNFYAKAKQQLIEKETEHFTVFG